MTNMKKTISITVTAVLSAVIALISFLPIKTLGFSITLSMVPIAVGAIMYGPAVGAILGAVFGLVSFIQCVIAYDPLGAFLLSVNPYYTFITCMTRVLAGLLTGLIFKGLRKLCKGDSLPIITAGISAALLNTVFFMSSLVICFIYGADSALLGFLQNNGLTSLADIIKGGNILLFVITFVGINGLVEILAGGFLTPPIAKALLVFKKKLEHSSKN